MKKSIFIIAVGILIIGQFTTAIAATINFDDYPPGPFTFAASDRYRALGVIFSRDIPIYSVAAVEPNWWVLKFQAGGGSLPNVMALSSAVDPRLTIDMTFVVPGTTIPATTDHVSALFADSEVGSTIGLFEAFDIDGTLIALSLPITPSTSTTVIEFNTPGIARVRFTDVDDGVEVDNISFNTPSAACHTQSEIDAAYAAGIKKCQDDPASCGINVTGGNYCGSILYNGLIPTIHYPCINVGGTNYAVDFGIYSTTPTFLLSVTGIGPTP